MFNSDCLYSYSGVIEMSTFKYRYKFLDKIEKDWVDCADEDVAIEAMRHRHSQPMFAHIIEVMKDLLEDAYDDGYVLTEAQKDFMLLPYKILGKAADKKLDTWRRVWWNQRKQYKRR